MPLNANALVPELSVSDLALSLSFYVDVLGFTLEYQRPEKHFAFLSFHGSHLMLDQDHPEATPWDVLPLDKPRGRGINLSIRCPEVESLARRVSRAGYPLRKALEDCWYRENDFLHGERNFLLMDPDGYLLRFQQPLGTRQVE